MARRGHFRKLFQNLLTKGKDEIPDLLIAPDLQLSLRFNVENLHKNGVEGVLKDGVHPVKIEAPHPPSLIKGLLGAYCGNPIKAKAQAILAEESEGKPIRLEPGVRGFKGSFVYKNGQAVRKFMLHYDPEKRVLKATNGSVPVG